jgi:hypothetical protein
VEGPPAFDYDAGLATALNAETLRSATGKDWAAEMVRTLLA